MNFFKWLIPLIICIGSFMIHTNNVNAEEYERKSFGTATCSGNYCNNFDSGNNIITIPNNSSSNSITRGETDLTFNNSTDLSSFNGFLVQIGLSYFDDMPVSYSDSIIDGWVCTNDINESGTITYADGTYALVSLGAECSEWEVSSSHSSYSQSGTLMTSSYSSLLYWYNENNGLNTCFLQTASNNQLVYNCPITPNTNSNVKKLKLVSYFRTDSDIKVEIAKYGTIAYKSDTSKLNQIITALQNNNTTQQQIQNNTNEIKNDLKDSSIDSNNTSSSASSWSNKNASNGTITNLLTLPISLLQNILNGIQTSCSSFSLGNLFNTELILPCINLSSLIGSTLFNIIDLLFSGFMILNIAKKLIKIFNDFTNLKSNQIDEIYSNGGGSN